MRKDCEYGRCLVEGLVSQIEHYEELERAASERSKEDFTGLIKDDLEKEANLSEDHAQRLRDQLEWQKVSLCANCPHK